MPIDRPGRPDENDHLRPDADDRRASAADRIDESRDLERLEQPTQQWRDPRDFLTAGDRARHYNRVHEPLSREELKALEAANVEQYGTAYDWDDTWDIAWEDADRFDEPTESDGQVPAEEPVGTGAHDADPSAPDVRPERADQPCPVRPPHTGVDYFPPGIQASDEGFVRDRANPTPVLDGPPTREQTAQGRIGDCGVVSTLGAVAGHRPEAIRNAITQTGPETYEVRLHQVTPSTPRDPVARPTGDTVTYIMDDKIPVLTNEPGRPPAGVKVETCAWPALMEKAVAAQDQAWDPQQKAEWDRSWLALKPYVDAERRVYGMGPSPRTAPTGYDRLDIGSTPYQRADLLAALTGEEAEVRTMPNEQQGEQALLDEFRDRLADGKPILVGTRAPRYRGELTGIRDLVFSHAYEVTKVENDKIHLRNPWGDAYTPPPIDAKTFWEYYRHYNHDGSRTGLYSTLT